MSFIGDMFGGGGGGQSPAGTTTVTTTGDIAPEIKPFMEEVLGEAQKQFQTEEFKTFPGPRIADFDPAQVQAHTGIKSLVDAGLGAAPNIGGSAQLAQQAQQALGQATQQTELADIQRLMNPYQQAVIDIQKREAERDFEGNILPQIGAQAAGSRAFGGSRQAIMEQEARRNLDQRLADIQATGSQQAYNQALAELGREKVRQQTGAGMYGQFAQQFPQQAFRELGALETTGREQQARDQRALDIALEDFLREEDFAGTQLAQYAGLVRGFPITGTSTQQKVASVPTPSLGQQLLGSGMAAMGMAGQLGWQPFGAGGGRVGSLPVRMNSGGQIQGGLASLERHQNNNMNIDIVIESILGRRPHHPVARAKWDRDKRRLITPVTNLKNKGFKSNDIVTMIKSSVQEKVEEAPESRGRNKRNERAERAKAVIHEKMRERDLNPNDPQDRAEYIRLNESISETPDFKYPGEIPDPTSAIQRRFDSDRMNRQKWIKENAERTQNLPIDAQADQWSESMGIVEEESSPKSVGLRGTFWDRDARDMIPKRRAEPLIEYMESLKGRRDIPVPVRKPVEILDEVEKREYASDSEVARIPEWDYPALRHEGIDMRYPARTFEESLQEFEPAPDAIGEGREPYSDAEITAIMEEANPGRGRRGHGALPGELRGKSSLELQNILDMIQPQRKRLKRNTVPYIDPRIIRRNQGGLISLDSGGQPITEESATIEETVEETDIQPWLRDAMDPMSRNPIGRLGGIESYLEGFRKRIGEKLDPYMEDIVAGIEPTEKELELQKLIGEDREGLRQKYADKTQKAKDDYSKSLWGVLANTGLQLASHYDPGAGGLGQLPSAAKETKASETVGEAAQRKSDRLDQLTDAQDAMNIEYLTLEAEMERAPLDRKSDIAQKQAALALAVGELESDIVAEWAATAYTVDFQDSPTSAAQLLNEIKDTQLYKEYGFTDEDNDNLGNLARMAARMGRWMALKRGDIRGQEKVRGNEADAISRSLIEKVFKEVENRAKTENKNKQEVFNKMMQSAGGVENLMTEIFKGMSEEDAIMGTGSLSEVVENSISSANNSESNQTAGDGINNMVPPDQVVIQ